MLFYFVISIGVFYIMIFIVLIEQRKIASCKALPSKSPSTVRAPNFNNNLICSILIRLQTANFKAVSLSAFIKLTSDTFSSSGVIFRPFLMTSINIPYLKSNLVLNKDPITLDLSFACLKKLRICLSVINSAFF